MNITEFANYSCSKLTVLDASDLDILEALEATHCLQTDGNKFDFILNA